LIGLGPVSKGQKIGYLSSNSNENGGYNFTHLHFGIRSDVYSTVADSDGGWRYRGYASSPNSIDFWYSPTTFLSLTNMQEIPDTGQTKCYDNSQEIPCPQPGEPFYGQDAQYSINPQSYIKLDANDNDLPDSATEWSMVRDNVTGLIWENKTADGSIHDKNNTYNWGDAQNVFIANLNASKFGGFSDWRLPEVKELSFIVNSDIYNPSINTTYYP